MFLKPPLIQQFVDQRQRHHILTLELLSRSYAAFVVVLEPDVRQVLDYRDEDVLRIILFKLRVVVGRL